MRRRAIYVAATLVGGALVLLAWFMPETRWPLVGLAVGVVAGMSWVARRFPPARKINLREAHLKRKVLVSCLLVALVTVSLGWWHHQTGARFQATVQPIATFGVSGCARELRRFGWGPSLVCTGAGGKPAFRLSIQNYGGRGAWATTCFVQGFDATGAPIPDAVSWAPIDLSSPGIGRLGQHLEPGASVTFDWFLPTTPSQHVAAYGATSNPVDYHGPAPI